MRFKTLQIVWHDKLPVLSCDFHVSGRLITAGADQQLKIWRIDTANEDVKATYEGCLTNHSRAINAVRFQGDVLASGGDGGELMLWSPAPTDEEGLSTWKVSSVLRGHSDDIIDLAWSFDGSGLASASIENSVCLWDTQKGKRKAVFNKHQHYVQGVAWDPLGQLLLSQSTDRTMRAFQGPPKSKPSSDKPDIALANRFAQVASVYSRPTASDRQTDVRPADSAAVQQPGAAAASQDKAGPLIPRVQGAEQSARLQSAAASAADPPADRTRQKRAAEFVFQDETLNTFFRRLAFSPEGSFVVAPSASLGNLAAASSCASAAAVFARSNLTTPIALLPTLTSAATCVRFCPILFRSSRGCCPSRQENDTAENTEAPHRPGLKSWAELDYKVVFAVGTIDSVFIYDTEHEQPLIVMAALHYKHITDLAWSHDGRCLVASSHDGYCTVATFDAGELGEGLTDAASMVSDLRSSLKEPERASNAKAKGGVEGARPPMQALKRALSPVGAQSDPKKVCSGAVHASTDASAPRQGDEQAMQEG